VLHSEEKDQQPVIAPGTLCKEASPAKEASAAVLVWLMLLQAALPSLCGAGIISGLHVGNVC